METVINPFTKRIIQSGGRTHQRVLKTLEQMGGDWDLSDCRHFEEIGSSISCYDLIGGVERLWYDQEYSEFTSPISIERNDQFEVPQDMMDAAMRVVEVMQDWGFDVTTR